VYLILKDPEETKESIPTQGLFFYADFFFNEDIEQVEKDLEPYFDVIRKENISANVLHSIYLT